MLLSCISGSLLQCSVGSTSTSVSAGRVPSTRCKIPDVLSSLAERNFVCLDGVSLLSHPKSWLLDLLATAPWQRWISSNPTSVKVRSYNRQATPFISVGSWIFHTGEPTVHRCCRPHTMARGRRREGEQSIHKAQAPALTRALQRRWQN